MKLKVCGMKYQDNINAVATLQPDYMGFIFYEKSSRFFENDVPKVPNTIKKVGVFVDASINYISEKINAFNLQAVQLHGNETPELCKNLKLKEVEIIKVFSIKDNFDFSVLKAYEDFCDYFLFDTKGSLPGGNGFTFNWETLKDYPSTKPFILSGGIGLQEIKRIKAFKNTQVFKYCYAIDINSKFEIKAGLKNIRDIQKFKNEL